MLEKSFFYKMIKIKLDAVPFALQNLMGMEDAMLAKE